MKINKPTQTIAPPSTRRQERIPQLEQAAKAYEQMFLNEMVKAMRQATPRAEQPSMAERIYEDQLFDNYTEQWANQGGVGLSDLIYDQMMERFGHIIRHHQKPKGPLHLQGKDKVNVQKATPSDGASLFRFQPSSDQKDPLSITLPWEGKIASVQRFENGRSIIHAHHDNGLKSVFVYNGTAKNLDGSQVIRAGESIGTAAPGSSEILWKVHT